MADSLALIEFPDAFPTLPAARGRGWIWGEGEPTADIGLDDDRYVDEATPEYFVWKKADGAWINTGKKALTSEEAVAAAAAAEEARSQAAGDRTQTMLDRAATAAHLAQVEIARNAALNDWRQTELNREATASDRVATGQKFAAAQQLVTDLDQLANQRIRVASQWRTIGAVLGLEDIDGPEDKSTGAVLGPDTTDYHGGGPGTHTDPVSGLTVPNVGLYRWVAGPAVWTWVGVDGIDRVRDLLLPETASLPIFGWIFAVYGVVDGRRVAIWGRRSAEVYPDRFGEDVKFLSNRIAEAPVGAISEDHIFGWEDIRYLDGVGTRGVASGETDRPRGEVVWFLHRTGGAAPEEPDLVEADEANFVARGYPVVEAPIAGYEPNVTFAGAFDIPLVGVVPRATYSYWVTAPVEYGGYAVGGFVGQTDDAAEPGPILAAEWVEFSTTATIALIGQQEIKGDDHNRATTWPLPFQKRKSWVSQSDHASSSRGKYGWAGYEMSVRSLGAQVRYIDATGTTYGNAFPLPDNPKIIWDIYRRPPSNRWNWGVWDNEVGQYVLDKSVLDGSASQDYFTGRPRRDRTGRIFFHYSNPSNANPENNDDERGLFGFEVKYNGQALDLEGEQIVADIFDPSAPTFDPLTVGTPLYTPPAGWRLRQNYCWEGAPGVEDDIFYVAIVEWEGGANDPIDENESLSSLLKVDKTGGAPVVTKYPVIKGGKTHHEVGIESYVGGGDVIVAKNGNIYAVFARWQPGDTSDGGANRGKLDIIGPIGGTPKNIDVDPWPVVFSIRSPHKIYRPSMGNKLSVRTKIPLAYDIEQGDRLYYCQGESQIEGGVERHGYYTFEKTKGHVPVLNVSDLKRNG
jgi:hypothetical protein